MNNILRYFEFDHLPEGPLRDTSQMFYALAMTLDKRLPDGDEKSVALRKLLESRDAAERVARDMPGADA